MNNFEYINKAIGNTPIVELSTDEFNINLYAKCEFVNPTGSHKDRMYKFGINKYEKEGIIKKGMTLVDFSSGNAGASLSMLSSLYGYKSIIVRPSGLSIGKKQQIINYGGEIIEIPKELGIGEARRKAIELTNELGESAFMMHQTDRPFNVDAFTEMGEEIVRYFKSIRKRIDVFVCPVGTGGTITAVGRVLKKHFVDIKIVGVDIEESPLLYNRFYSKNKRVKSHNIEGMSVGEVFLNTDLSIIDEVLTISANDSWLYAKEIGRKYQLWVGPSSGSGFCASLKYAKKVNKECNMLTVFWDHGWKYI